MANDLTTKVWFLDTVGATSAWPPYVHIKTIYWKSPTTAGDVLLINQTSGHVLLAATCEVNGQSQVWNFDNKYAGFILVTLTSGTVEVHIK